MRRGTLARGLGGSSCQPEPRSVWSSPTGRGPRLRQCPGQTASHAVPTGRCCAAMCQRPWHGHGGMHWQRHCSLMLRATVTGRQWHRGRAVNGTGSLRAAGGARPARPPGRAAGPQFRVTFMTMLQCRGRLAGAPGRGGASKLWPPPRNRLASDCPGRRRAGRLPVSGNLKAPTWAAPSDTRGYRGGFPRSRRIRNPDPPIRPT